MKTTPSAPIDFKAAERHLGKADAKLKPIIKKVGDLPFRPRRDHYHALCEAIANQQLSGKAAATIFGRVQTVAGAKKLTPQRIAPLTDQQLLGCGLSRMKVAFIRDLTDKVQSRQLVFSKIRKLSDDDAIADLTRVKGIGVWSAQMYLMFVLHRPDILPLADGGIRSALKKVYGLTDQNLDKQAPALAEPWRPYRTVACWYLWASLDAGGI